MKTIIAAVAMLLPVAAAAQAPEIPTSGIAAPTPSGGPATTAPKPTRYCVLSSETGTRLLRKTCRTREEWLADGFDPLQAKR